jgi:hypothetical protein
MLEPVTALPNVIDEILRGRADEHPDIATLVSMRARGAADPDPRMDAPAHPDVMALFTLDDGSPAAQQARAHAWVDALCGRGAAAAARVADVTTGEAAALAWFRTVTGEEAPTALVARIHETSIRLRTGIDDRCPATTLMPIALNAIDTSPIDRDSAGGNDATRDVLGQHDPTTSPTAPNSQECA